MMRIHFTFLLLLFFALSMPVPAQSSAEKAAAGDVVTKLFVAMNRADADGIRSAFSSGDSQIVAIRRSKEGKSSSHSLSAETFSKAFTKPGSAVELMYALRVEVDGDWAMVWGRYVFYSEGKLSHCGINQFNLLRTDAGWKIVNAASTMDANACTAQEKALRPPPGKK